MAASASVVAKITGTLTDSADLQAQTSALISALTFALTDGSGANHINQMWSDQRTLSASATEDHDLAGGLTDVYGNTITFTKIKAILVSAAAANTNGVEVGGAAANGFDSWVGAAEDHVIVKPGGVLLIVAPDADGYAVTAGTGDLLTITNDAGSTAVTYDIVLLGVE
jgi:hypothetical protein